MSTKQNQPEPVFRVPLALRVGGAFMALALALLVFTVIAVFSDGWGQPYDVTGRMLVLLLAAAILGAFATIRRDQASGRSQIIALIVAVALVVVARFIANESIYRIPQYLLAMYAVFALFCALIIRRSLIPKD